MNILFHLIAIPYFLIIGSFLNVCILRIPDKNSIVFPPSSCPACHHRLGVLDLVPIVSYLFLKGKCRYCKSEISNRYITVELLTGLLLSFLFIKYNVSIVFFKYIVLVCILIVVAFIDMDFMIVPNEIIIFGLMAGVIFCLIDFSIPNLISTVSALFIGSGVFLLIAVVSNGAMGGGDIKLMGVIGLFLGIKGILLTIFLSFFIGAIVSVFLLYFKIKSRKDYIPFAPFIACATYITILFGDQILNWYLK